MFATTTALRRTGAALALCLLAGGVLAGAALAQGGGQTFPQTGHTVSGLFWTYWQAHGGLTQQGYPLSEQFQEVSDLNGKSYTVQYFERAVMELHPEDAAPYDVLLSQLGTFRYHSKYPNGAPGQVANQAAGHFFPQTGHWVGGKFWAYWQAHGGLAQQGYPLSEEFQEKSDLDGKTYTVQYFERAVMELHPENAAPYDVLLSQLGTFRLHAKYPAGAPTPVPGAASPTPAPAGTPGAVPAAVLDLLTRSDAAMNALTAMKGHSVNQTTDAGTTKTDTADYQFQAPGREYLKVVSPQPGQPAAVAEEIRLGSQHYRRTGGSGPWTLTTDSPPFQWPQYNKVYVATHSLGVTLESPSNIGGVPVQIVHVTVPATINGTAVADQYIDYYISTVDARVLREVTTVPALPPSRSASGVYTTDFSDFNVANTITAPTDVKP